MFNHQRILKKLGPAMGLKKNVAGSAGGALLDVVQCKQPTYEKCHYSGKIGYWPIETACWGSLSRCLAPIGVMWAFAKKREKTAQKFIGGRVSAGYSKVSGHSI